jgi:NAD(P)H-hydrate epimerase
MQAIDRAAIETVGIPRLLLMDHAGFALARAVDREYSDRRMRLLIACGNGYNGGDGFSAARHLQAMGYPIQIILAGRIGELKQEPAVFANISKNLGIPVEPVWDSAAAPALEALFKQADLIIDALLGIGVRGEVRDPVRSLIERINLSGKPVIAADLPSGLDGDTGEMLGIGVRATHTVTFGRPKHGCFIAQGPGLCGRLHVDPISFPAHLLRRQE